MTVSEFYIRGWKFLWVGVSHPAGCEIRPASCDGTRATRVSQDTNLRGGAVWLLFVGMLEGRVGWGGVGVSRGWGNCWLHFKGLKTSAPASLALTPPPMKMMFYDPSSSLTEGLFNELSTGWGLGRWRGGVGLDGGGGRGVLHQMHTRPLQPITIVF